MKKVISLFLSAMMILTSVLCVNFSAFAKDIESGSIELGKNTVKASEFDYKDDEVDETKINFSFTLAQKHTLSQGYDSYIRTDYNGDKYDHYYLDKVIYSEGNTITETKEDGTKVTYTCKNTKANEDDEDDFRFVDGDRNLFPYRIDCDSAQSRNHLKTGNNVQCYFTVRSDDYNIDVPFTIDIKKFNISNITFTLAQKHTLTQGYDSYIDIDDDGDEFDLYEFWNVIYSEGNTLTVTKTDGTKTVYTYDNNYYDFVDGDGNHFDYEMDIYTSQSKNHLKPGNDVECSFRVYKIDVPFTVDIDENPVASIEYIGNITVSDKDKHTDDDGDYYYDYTIYQPGAKIVIHYKNKNKTSDTYICKSFYDEDDMDTHYRFINVNDSEDWVGVSYSADTPTWTAGGNNLIYIMCHSVITTIPVTVIPSTPMPNPTPNPTLAPSPAPAQPAPAPSTSTSTPAAQTTAQPAATKIIKR